MQVRKIPMKQFGSFYLPFWEVVIIMARKGEEGATRQFFKFIGIDTLFLVGNLIEHDLLLEATVRADIVPRASVDVIPRRVKSVGTLPVAAELPWEKTAFSWTSSLYGFTTPEPYRDPMMSLLSSICIKHRDEMHRRYFGHS